MYVPTLLQCGQTPEFIDTGNLQLYVELVKIDILLGIMIVNCFQTFI